MERGRISLSDNEPLVSVGIPTYNRASDLPRAVESVLAQSYGNLELIISDNASTDETAQVCESFCRRDPRVRYIRQPENLGPVGNFAEVLRHSKGEYFMWLADDDWLDPTYIEECLAVLVRHPEYVLVAGAAKYFQNGAPEFQEEVLNLTADRPMVRVQEYYWRVDRNGIFYGLMRRAAISRLSLENVLASDWLTIAALAVQGKLTTLEHVSVHREIGGASSKGIEQLAMQFGLTGINLWNPFLYIARRAASDILWHSPAYRSLPGPERLWLALKVFRIIQYRHGLPFAEYKLQNRTDLPSRVVRRLISVARR
jgi:glycosyltransferase involved in cell wall biosynthesis